MTDSFYRLTPSECQVILSQRIAEKSPGLIQLVTGPRQVGKTTLLLKMQGDLGARGLYRAADTPEAHLPGFWERVWSDAEATARQEGKAVLFLDEIQLVHDWSARVKGSWDRIKREATPLHIIASGSSALRLGHGSKESLAGRFERLTIAHWPASALVSDLGVARDEAADVAVRFGTYPGAVPMRAEVARWKAYVRDAIVEPAIGTDILALGGVRRPALLRQLFGICTSMPAQIVSLRKLQGQMHDAGVLETIANYLSLLEDAYLIAPLEKFSPATHRRRAAPSKIVVLNNALLGALDPREPPDPSTDPARFGAWVENACLAHAWNAGQHVSYWREEPLEVDGVIDGSWGKWAIEVKTGPFDSGALRGLFEFCRRHAEFRPLVVTRDGDEHVARRAGARAMSWRDFLLGRAPDSQ